MEQYPEREPTEEERLRQLPQWLRPKWVRVCLTPIYYLAMLATVVLHISPQIALLFGVSLAVAGVAAFAGLGPVYGSYLAAVVVPYAVLSVFTYFVILTFNHQHCCRMTTGFWRHTFAHRPYRIATAVVEAAFWPLTWGVYDRALTGWGLCWSLMVLQALDQWLVTLFSLGRPRVTMVVETYGDPEPPKEERR